MRRLKILNWMVTSIQTNDGLIKETENTNLNKLLVYCVTSVITTKHCVCYSGHPV
jgi:hypothetical protein